MRKYLESFLGPKVPADVPDTLHEKKQRSLHWFFTGMYVRLLAPGLLAARTTLARQGIAIQAHLPTMSLGRFRQHIILLYANPERVGSIVITAMSRVTLRLRGGEIGGKLDGTVQKLPLGTATEEDVRKAVSKMARSLRKEASAQPVKKKDPEHGNS